MITFQGKQFDTWADARAHKASIDAAPAVAPVATVDPPAPAAEPFALSSEPDKPRCRQSLADKYRPRKLAEVVGQDDAIAILSAFAADPYPAAFILAGETGTGKTSAAWALAADLGCAIDVNPPEFGGIHSMPSGEQNADALRELWPLLWQMPFMSSRGWKVLIVNEIEQLNGTVERLWLDKLEDIPPATVIVFTTNSLASLPARFVDRCIGGVLEFRASADDLGEHARSLARSIWRAETGAEIPADTLDRIVSRSITAGRLSLRRIVQNLTPLIAAKGKP